ncbi:hypothetical protein [Paenibacillus sp. Y412MC10]|uniref:hypothetical protein n=1 Tax=Geobacillus sp. (strain Y412MC10) TaxID=481743 RepID=UPI00119D2514|nr:hypothetical protein [Paenibacillus sp. Y412MC10]
MKKILVLILTISILLISCSKTESQPKIIDNLIDKQYVELGNIAAFKNDNNISLYQTFWILKIFDHFSIPIKYRESIGKWLSNIDITNQSSRDSIGLTGLPLEECIIMYLEALKILEYPLTDEHKTKILSKLIDLEKNTGPINEKNITIYSKLFDIYQLIDTSTKMTWYVPYHSFLENNLDKLNLFNIYHLYSYNRKIVEEKINREIHNTTINNLDYKKIIDAYHINIMKKSNNGININREFVQKSFKKLINLDSSIDPQLMFYLISLDEDAITNDLKNQFSEIFNSLIIQNKAWGENSSILSLDNTYFSLEILDYYQKLDKIDLDRVKNFLDEKLVLLQQKDRLNLYDINNLRTLALSYQVIGDKEALNIIEGMTIKKVNILEEKEINPVILDSIITIAIATNSERIADLSESTRNESKKIINELSEKKNKSFQDVFFLYSLKKFSGNWKEQDKYELNKLMMFFLDSKGGILSSNKESIGDTYNFVKLFNYLKMDYPEKTYDFLVSSIKELSNNNLITLAITISSLRIIKEGGDN